MTKTNNKDAPEFNSFASANTDFMRADSSEIHRVKEINARLEKRIEQQTLQLIEVTESNIQFISIIAHDLRSPFGSILGALEVLKKSITDGDKDDVEMLVSIAAESAKRTLNLLDNLLIWTISQNNGNSFVPEKVKFNLHEVINAQIEQYEGLALQKQISLHYLIADGTTINADHRMIATVIRNLIDNAIKYTKPGGEIIIHTVKKGEFIEIIVKDNGIGMSSDTRENILKTDSLKSAGTSQKAGGLGLLLCKELVQTHRGSISLESERGLGSKFTVILPLDS